MQAHPACTLALEILPDALRIGLRKLVNIDLGKPIIQGHISGDGHAVHPDDMKRSSQPE